MSQVTTRWSSGALEDREHWRRHEPRVMERLELLLESIGRTPHAGLGKPKPLNGELAGWWSRRLTLEHLLVYRVEGRTVWVLQARYHY